MRSRILLNLQLFLMDLLKQSDSCQFSCLQPACLMHLRAS